MMAFISIQKNYSEESKCRHKSTLNEMETKNNKKKEKTENHGNSSAAFAFRSPLLLWAGRQTDGWTDRKRTFNLKKKSKTKKCTFFRCLHNSNDFENRNNGHINIAAATTARQYQQLISI